MAKTSTEAIELPAKGQEPDPEQAPVVETDHLDETRAGSFAGYGAVAATFRQDVMIHLTYPPSPGDRVYRVNPVDGTITERIA